MYFFVSSKNFNNKILTPRIPKNRLTKNGKEDNIVPRICVSKSLLGCIESTEVYGNYKRIYVHTCQSIKVTQPSLNQVNDAYLFGEEWILEPVEMKLFTILYMKKEIINEHYSKLTFRNKDETILFFTVRFDYKRFYGKKSA